MGNSEMIMKKIFAFLLAFSILLALLSGCVKEEMEPAGEVSGFESERHFGVESTSANSEDVTEESAERTFSGEFIVSEKKYAYKNENLMLLHVQNDTDTHYDVTIIGRYLDADGNTIKEESQSYRAFSSGWENYFLFRPKGTFESFEYELETKKFEVVTEYDEIYANNGEPLSAYVTVGWMKDLHWTGNPFNSRDLEFTIKAENQHPAVIAGIEGHVLILDEQGEVYGMDYEYYDTWGGQAAKYPTTNFNVQPIGGEGDGRTIQTLRMQPKDGDESLPDQSKLTFIFARSCTIDHTVMDRLYWAGKLPSDYVL